MASFTELKAYIQSYIYQNSAGDISGQDLQRVLIEMVEKMGDDAINAIAAAVADEITARQNAVQGEADTRATAVQNEATARYNADQAEKEAREAADTALGNRITNEIRAEAQRAEAAFDNLELEDTAGAGAQPTQINLTLRKNDGTEEDPDWRTLTQLILASATTSKAGLMSAADKSSLDYILDQFAFVGVASTSTNPGTPQEKVFYLTAEKGTFTNFLDGSSHALSFAMAGLRVLYYVPNSGWQYSNIILIEDKPNANSSSLVKSGGVDAAIRSMVGYLVCTTAGATAAKTITGSFYILQQGGSLKVKFTYKNTADDATLKIGDAEAQPLYYAGRRAGSSNSWEAGEVVEIFYDGENYYANNVMGGGAGDGAFDISVYNAVEGTPTQYASLSAALGTNGANIPQSLRKGGMSIKYVQSIDNKYVQYRLMSDTFNTTPANWQGMDNEPTAGSKNFVDSGGVYNVTTAHRGVEKNVFLAIGGTTWSAGNGYMINIENSDVIYIKANSGVNSVYAFLTNDDTSGQAPSFVSNESSAYYVLNDKDITVKKPTGAKFLFVSLSGSGTDRTPQAVKIDGISININVATALPVLKNETDNELNTIKPCNFWKESQSLAINGTAFINGSGYLIEVSDKSSVTIKAKSVSNAVYAFLTNYAFGNASFVSGESTALYVLGGEEKTVQVPNDAVYLFITEYDGLTNRMPEKILIDGIQFDWNVIQMFHSIQGEVNALKNNESLFVQKSFGVNLFNDKDKNDVYGAYLFSNGEIIHNTSDFSWNVSGFIFVDGNAQYHISSSGDYDVDNNSDPVYFAFYDSGFNFISTVFHNTQVTTPVNAAYMRITYRNSRELIMVNKGTERGLYEDYNPVGGYKEREVINIYTNDSQTEIFDKLLYAFSHGNKDVYFETGTYTFDTIYQNMKTSGYADLELPIGGNCRYFLNNSTLVCNRPDGLTDAIKTLGTWRSVQSFELHDGKIVCEDGVYCVHDEADGKEGYYKHVYKNLIMQYISDSHTVAWSKCIGGGCGRKADIDIEGCVFMTDNTGVSGADVGWHIDYDWEAHGTVHNMKWLISNCYFSRGFEAVGNMPDNHNLFVQFSNNSYKELTLLNWKQSVFNNQLRES